MTEEVDAPWQPVKFTTGWKDACAVFFYFLITIVMHAVVQEYILDVSIINYITKTKKLIFGFSSTQRKNNYYSKMTFYNQEINLLKICNCICLSFLFFWLKKSNRLCNDYLK